MGLASVASLVTGIRSGWTLLYRLFRGLTKPAPATMNSRFSIELSPGMLAYAVVFFTLIGWFFGSVAVNGLLDPGSDPGPFSFPDFSDF
jgi:hypothetical protein